MDSRLSRRERRAAERKAKKLPLLFPGTTSVSNRMIAVTHH
jgi:hypothetical protein